MQAAILHRPGPAGYLTLTEMPRPAAGDGQVLVRVRAFGLNRSELMTRKGLSPNVTFPRVLGIECVGEVAHDPSGALQEGQQVMAFMGGMGRDFDGSYAGYTVVPQSLVYPFTSTLPWEVLGAVPEMYQTVHGSLVTALDVKKGERLLIRGGTSSVGLLAAQVAAHLGVTVLATTRHPEKLDVLRENRVTHPLVDNGRLRDQVAGIYPEGVDKVLELVGTPTLRDSLQCLRPGGTACMSGMLSEQWSIPDFAPMEFIPPTVRLTVYDSGQVRSPARAFHSFLEILESGDIKLPLGPVFTLDQIVEAHEMMESNRANGKIVVRLP